MMVDVLAAPRNVTAVRGRAFRLRRRCRRRGKKGSSCSGEAPVGEMLGVGERERERRERESE